MIVDDYAVVRLGLKNLLTRQPGWQVIAEAGTGSEAVRRADELKPDLILMDVRLGQDSGIEACREIVKKHPAIKVIMLTSFAEDELLVKAISAGAVGYMLKQTSNDHLLQTIQKAVEGSGLLSPAATHQALAELHNSTRPEAFTELSARELKVLSLIMQGKTNKEIAASLYLGEGTIRNYVGNILDKLGLANRAEATAYAIRHNLDLYLRP
ncbi:MAG: response regulator transcription factor [Anaerolineales bacterium]|nr:response regulator transcription factor [Anaerolineales bacterium]